MNPLLWSSQALWFSAIALVVFLCFTWYCRYLDKTSCSTESYRVILMRLYARHIKLVLNLAFGIAVAAVAAFCALSMASELNTPVSGTPGGIQTEKLAGFINRATKPIQWVVDGLIGLLGLLALLFFFGVTHIVQFYRDNSTPCIIAMIVLYLIWLYFAIRDIVEDEMSADYTCSECGTEFEVHPSAACTDAEWLQLPRTSDEMAIVSERSLAAFAMWAAVVAVVVAVVIHLPRLVS